MSTLFAKAGRPGVRATLALAVLAALQSTHAFGATPSPAPVAAATRLSQGDAVLGALPLQTPMQVVIGLKLRDRAELEAFVQEGARTVVAGGTPRLMSSDEALARHAPTQAQAQAVADYLTARGFHNVTISPSRMLVSADGTAMTARDAFGTTFVQVRTRDGRFAYANNDVVRIPAVLGGIVDSVLGLQNVHVPRSFARRAGSGGVHTMDTFGHSPVDFPAIYGVGTAAAATSIPVGIVTEGNIAQTKTDLNSYTDSKSLPRVTTSTVNTNGTSGDTAGIGEWDLDSQDIVGMSGGVQKLIFYNIPSLSNADLTADFDTIRNKDAVKIANVSLGECEKFTMAGSGDGSATTDDAILLLAAAQGQTFSVSTGDTGADECGDGTNTPSYPASSPWVVAVAGTRLNTSGATETTWVGERSWTDSGGSPSTFEPMPAWQTAFGVPGTMRGPDVAFEGDPNSGSQIIVNGTLAQYGGTSLSAPLFAGLWARVLQAHPTLGFAAPVLYQVPGSAFHDITAGKNSGGETGIGYSAVAGYDFATGRGSMKIGATVNNTTGLNKQLFLNTGFEGTTSTAWNANPTTIIVNNAANAHAGNFYASMGGTTSSTQTLQQTVTITAGKTLASLRFYLKTTTAETGTTAKDTLSVDAYLSGHLLGNLGKFSNLDAATTGYVQRGLDASAFIGQRLTIRFTATNDGTNATTFAVDDVTLNVE